MAEVSEVILKLEVDSKSVTAEIDKVKGKYAEVNEEVKKQQQELNKLVSNEKALLAERAKTNNPSVIAQFNKEIADNKANIDKLTTSIKAQTATTKELDNTTKKAGEDIKQAFEGTQVVSLRSQLRKLKEEIANATDPEEMARLSVEAGKVKDKIDDAATAANIFASESKFQVLGSAIGDVGAKLLQLDFKGAADSSSLLVKASKQISFKDALTGIKDLGSTLLNVGKALLTNPLFLIGAAVTLIISNFDKLKNSGGLVGSIFKFIGNVINGVVQAFKDLTDAIGLTDNAAQEASEKLQKSLEEQFDATQKTANRILEIRKAKGKNTVELEKQQTKELIDLVNKQADAYIASLQRQGKSLSDLSEEELKKIKELGDTKADLLVKQATLELNQTKEANEKRQKANEDAAKKAKEAKDKENALRLQQEKELTALLIGNIKDEAEKKRAQASSDFNDGVIAAKGNAQIITQLRIKLNNELATIDEDLEKKRIEALKTQAEFQKQFADKAIEISTIESGGLNNVYSARIAATVDYYDKLISLTKEGSQDRLKLEQDLKAELAKLDQDENKRIESTNLEKISEEEKHQLALLSIANKSESVKLALEIQKEKEKLDVLKLFHGEETAEIIAQNNKIAELEAQLTAKTKEESKKRLQQSITDLDTLLKASLDAAEKIIQIKIDESDRIINAQQKRVDEATKIADKGNAELLQLEQERLDQANKQKEKFVRAQQALNAVELISETAVMVAKAGSEGGAAAGITIAAALIALVAGLAQARSVAGQAAFYEGGEFNGQGYTGEGNPRGESRRLGAKPYIYHNKEYIFNHKTTSKYLDHFRAIHEGKLDLNDTVNKAKLFESFNQNKLNLNREFILKPIVYNNDEIGKLKATMDNIYSAIKGQERLSVNIDENGISAIASRHISKINRLNNLTR